MTNEKTCFVIMPIGAEGSDIRKNSNEVYNYLIIPGVSQAKRMYKCIRADEVQKPNNIVKDIARKLKTAEVVIADLTGQNPNVFYELGVRHALGGKTIILSQSLNDVPFDLRSIRTIIYDTKTPSGNDATKKQIAKFLQELDDEPGESDNPVTETIGKIPERISDSQPAGLGDSVSHELEQLRRVIDVNSYNLLQQTEHLSAKELKKTIQQAIDEKFASLNLDSSRHEDIAILEDLRKAGIANAYTRRDVAMKRILDLLPGARENVWLMGISLRKFFHRTSELNDRIRALRDHPLEWRALVIDPDTDQALFRSLREQETTYKKMLHETQLNFSNMETSELFGKFEKIYMQMQLYTDVMQTKQTIKVATEDLGLKIVLRFYRAAPVAFLAIIDDSIFVEQYHYGATTDDRVAEQVPVLEFRRGSDMFRQLHGHFEYVWNNLARSPFES